MALRESGSHTRRLFNDKDNAGERAKVLDAIVDVVLAYKPKPKMESAKKRKKERES